MAYISNTESDRQNMLDSIGVKGFDELLSPIPENIRFTGTYRIPTCLSELEIVRVMKELARQNVSTEQCVSFLGGGSYDHYVPAVIGEILSRSEYYTAYTPYQAEVSQGTLQSIYEYQTMIAELTGMDAANASMYDGGSATAEAVLMACDKTRRSRVILSPGIHPWYSQIIRTYGGGQGVELISLPERDGGMQIEDLAAELNDRVGALVIQFPNFFGCVEDHREAVNLAHRSGAFVIVAADPISLGLLSPPGEWGADIVTAEGQGLGLGLNLGGPYLGIFACRKELVRRLPGRLIGRTIDRRGNKGFVMTLQTREQHIRRDKATSNICTNQGLMALAAAVYMTLMGKQGISETANLCLQKSHYLAEKLQSISGVNLPFSRPFFKEFTIALDKGKVHNIINEMPERGFLPGISLEPFGYPDHMLVAVTEKRSKEDMDSFSEAFREVMV